MYDGLLEAYAVFKNGTLWKSSGRCKGFAVSNPAEAAKIDVYVAKLAAGENPAAPVLSTATGKGLVGMLDAMAAPGTAPVPPVEVQPPPVLGDRPASFYTGPLGTNNLLPPVGKGFLASMFGGVGYDKAAQRAQISQRQSQIGRKYSVVQSHYDGGRGTFGGVYGCEDPTAYTPTCEQHTIDNGSHVMVAWTPNYSIGEINAGQADAIWKKMGTYWAGFAPARVMVRAFHEFDMGNRYGIGGPGGPYTGPQFKAAWERMVSTIRGVASNVGFMWCPTEGAIDRSKLATYYPGDNLVDWVGTDWYNTASWASPLHDGFAQMWELVNYSASAASSVWSQYDIYGSGKAVSGQRGLTLPAGLPTTKPFMVGETSTVFRSGITGDWFRQVTGHANGVKSMSNCVGVSFHCDVHSPSDYDWRVDSNAAVPNVVGQPDADALAGFVAMAKDPYWVVA